MSAPSLRPIAAPLVIAAAISAGVSWLVLTPLHEAERDASRRLNALRASAAGVEALRADSATWAERSGAQGELESRLEALNAPARSSSAVHDAVSSAAQRAGVVLDTIRPGEGDTRAARPGASRPPRGTEGLSCTLAGVADYASLLRLIDEIEENSGFATVAALRALPVYEGQSVSTRFSLTTEHRVIEAPRPEVVEADDEEGGEP